MTRLSKNTAAMMMIGLMAAGTARAGEANTSASATNGYGHPGTAAATANYEGLGGQGFARTRTDTTGPLSIGRGLAVGFDEQGLDVSFSHALAPQVGPAYAGTFNMSIGPNGQVATSYGGTLAQGGLVRTAEAGGSTRSDRYGATASANASGHTAPGGRVNSWTESNSSPTIQRGGVGHTPLGRTGHVVAAAPVSYGRPMVQAVASQTRGHNVRPIAIQRSSMNGLRR